MTKTKVIQILTLPLGTYSLVRKRKLSSRCFIPWELVRRDYLTLRETEKVPKGIFMLSLNRWMVFSL
jgi:hypothetical protein